MYPIKNRKNSKNPVSNGDMTATTRARTRETPNPK